MFRVCAVQHHATTKNIEIQNLETVVERIKNRVLLLTRFSALSVNQRYMRENYSCSLTGQRIKSSKIESFALRSVVFFVDLNVS